MNRENSNNSSTVLRFLADVGVANRTHSHNTYSKPALAGAGAQSK